MLQCTCRNGKQASSIKEARVREQTGVGLIAILAHPFQHWFAGIILQNLLEFTIEPVSL
jgi:hypothetical protein